MYITNFTIFQLPFYIKEGKVIFQKKQGRYSKRYLIFIQQFIEERNSIMKSLIKELFEHCSC